MHLNLRVLHIATSLKGGAGIAANRLNSSLNTIGVESILLTNSSNFKYRNLEKSFIKLKNRKKIKSKTLTILQKYLIQKDKNLLTPLSVSKISPVEILKLKPDIIHIHNFYNLLSYENITQLCGLKIPIFITLHDERFLTGGCHCTNGCLNFEKSCAFCPQAKSHFHHLVKKKKKKLNALIESSPNIFFICPSKWIQSQAMKAFPNVPLNLEIIHNPIASEYLKNDLELDERKFSKDYVVLFVSENINNPYKGFSQIAECIKIYSDQLNNANIIFRFVGKGEISQFRNIKYTQWPYSNDKEMIRHYQSSDLLIVPSTTDNSPNIIYESTICGTPFICSNASGLPELADHFGMLQFDTSNPKEILDAILLQKSRTVNRNQLRKLALEHVDPSMVSHKIKNLYQKKLGFG